MRVLAVLLVWTVMMCRAGTAPALPSSSDSTTVTKVVAQYALTSANDFPQRDPQDWRFMGSKDGGITWMTLDVRKGELFLERHQRRIFKIAQPEAFNMYRLQIERVRDPASANSVHLAELEPLGLGEDDPDPIPSFEDRITVQGENGPLESRFQIFDGRPETKWLDFANENTATRSSWVQWQYVRQVGVVVTNVQQLLGLRARAREGYAVSIPGVLLRRIPGANILCFLDATGYVEIPCADERPFVSGQQALLEGTSIWRNKQVEIDRCRFTVQGPKASETPRRITMEQPLGANEELQWVEVEGTVQFCSRPENHLILELQDQNQVLEAQVLHLEPGATPPRTGARVKVRGICGVRMNARGESVVGTLWVPSLESISPISTNNTVTVTAPSPLAREPGPNSETLNNVRQIRALNPGELARRPRVRIRGVTTEVFGGYVQDETGGIELWLGSAPPQQPALPGLGTYVEVTGWGGWIEARGPVIHVEKVVPMGKGKLPKPERPTWAQLTSGRMVDQWIELEGVVRSTDGSHLLLTCDSGSVMATIRLAPAARVHELVDATVRLRGVGIMASDDRGQVQGVQLVVPSLEYVEVRRPAVDAFSLPCRPIASLFQVSGPRGLTHRVKVEGVLTFREGRRFFLRDDTGAAMAIGREEVVLDTPPGAYHWAFYRSAEPARTEPEGWEFKPGDRVQVVGFPENRAGYSPVLTEVLVRKVGQAALVPPVEASVSDIALGKLDSTLVTLQAVFLGREELGAHQVFQLQAGEQTFQAITPAQSPVPGIVPGSRVRVTGVCQVEPSPFPELGKRINSFKILLVSPGAVAVLQRPPWWTPKRALTMAGASVLVLAAAAAWIAMLRRQVEVRTIQLKKEIEERKRMEAEVELGHNRLLNASRKAGMADVATSVLHNVGNVLNSANMMSTLIAEDVRQSKVSTLVKAVGLMSEHRQNLGQFLTEDERGRHLPGLMEQLASHLSEERSRLQRKADALTESVQHIKQVVAMQQKHAKGSSVMETVAFREVVEDALRLSGEAFADHDIEVRKECETAVTAIIDRHKVLEILLNLLENAKWACLAGDRHDKRVTVRIVTTPGEQGQIRVQDNGVGIPAENLPRIFAQGFTTRKDGHGFGLHSSMLAAQDMGGSLTVHSEGSALGATFTLELPLSPEPR